MTKHKTDSYNSYMTTPSVTPELVAYLAGIFDGEGSINISIKKSNNTVTIYVSVGSVDFKLPELFRSVFGGYVTTPRISSPLSKRLLMTWKATNKPAIEFLKAIYPHLIVKKRQAALTFKVRKIITQNLRQNDAHRTQKLQSLADEIKNINQGRDAHVETVKVALEEAQEMIQSGVPVEDSYLYTSIGC